MGDSLPGRTATIEVWGPPVGDSLWEGRPPQAEVWGPPVGVHHREPLHALLVFTLPEEASEEALTDVLLFYIETSLWNRTLFHFKPHLPFLE